jgi:hypothetical protein
MDTGTCPAHIFSGVDHRLGQSEMGQFDPKQATTSLERHGRHM